MAKAHDHEVVMRAHETHPKRIHLCKYIFAVCVVTGFQDIRSQSLNECCFITILLLWALLVTL
jgi:hypothetical protein